MAKPQFGEVWNRIVGLAGTIFHTKTGLEFTFHVSGTILRTSRTDYDLSRADFETAYGMVPLSGPGEINEVVRGPAYVWAILHDTRVTKGDW